MLVYRKCHYLYGVSCAHHFNMPISLIQSGQTNTHTQQSRFNNIDIITYRDCGYSSMVFRHGMTGITTCGALHNTYMF